MCHVTTFCTVRTLQRETSLHEGISHGKGQKIKAALADSFFLLRTLEGVTEIRTSFLLNTEIRCVFKNKIMIKISHSCWDKKHLYFTALVLL